VRQLLHGADRIVVVDHSRSVVLESRLGSMS
jgi:hypothetical protein